MDLAQGITQLKETYLPQLSQWSTHIEPDELDSLTNELARMMCHTEGLTQQLKKGDPDLFQTQWKPLLDQMATLIPAVRARLEDTLLQTREKLQQLKHGKTGLSGYRRQERAGSQYFDSDT